MQTAGDDAPTRGNVSTQRIRGWVSRWRLARSQARATELVMMAAWSVGNLKRRSWALARRSKAEPGRDAPTDTPSGVELFQDIKHYAVRSFAAIRSDELKQNLTRPRCELGGNKRRHQRSLHYSAENSAI